MEFENLVGEHDLIYVEEGVIPLGDHWEYEDSAYLKFVLDGVAYTAVEDPEDGYRSSLKYLLVEAEIPIEALLCEFPPQRVRCEMRPEGLYPESTRDADADMLAIIDVVTGKDVILVGTDYADSYYPFFVHEYHPENLAINQHVDE